MNNKDKIESAILDEIQEHRNEITRLKEVLNHYKYSMGGTSIEKKTPVKRKYVKSGKYAKNKPSSGLRHINWRVLIPSTIKSKGRPMTSQEIIRALFIGKHKSTLKILKRRLSVILTIYKNDGILKTDKNGRGLKYGLPSMF